MTCGPATFAFWFWKRAPYSAKIPPPKKQAATTFSRHYEYQARTKDRNQENGLQSYRPTSPCSLLSLLALALQSPERTNPSKLRPWCTDRTLQYPFRYSASLLLIDTRKQQTHSSPFPSASDPSLTARYHQTPKHTYAARSLYSSRLPPYRINSIH